MSAEPGPGTGRSYYATPWELRYRPWTLDFTPDDAGSPPFPHTEFVNPYQVDAYGKDDFIEWTTNDWDPALRFWTLPYDPQLTQWLRVVDPVRPSIMAAREFGAQDNVWRCDRKKLLDKGWLEDEDLAWQPNEEIRRRGPAAAWSVEKARAANHIRAEIEELQLLMQDDRDRYLAEIDAQADGVPDYFISFIGASHARHPWTIELISCGLAISNIAYMYYKQHFKRARPSTLCPGLIPPFGPPAHPAFPSGHSCAGHLIALFLLEIPGLRQRYGIFRMLDGTPGALPEQDTLRKSGSINSPMLWLANRLAKNRERLGVHYPSDSRASRHLAAGIWWALLHETDEDKRIVCPSLYPVLAHAIAEWPAIRG